MNVGDKGSISLIGASRHVKEYYQKNVEFLDANGKFMYWWDFNIRKAYRKRLENQGSFWLYVYEGDPVQKITFRCLVDRFYSTGRRNVGLPSPEPEFTLPRQQGWDYFPQGSAAGVRSADQARIACTWLRIVTFERLDVPLFLQEFIEYDTQHRIHTSALISSFAYVPAQPAIDITAPAV